MLKQGSDHAQLSEELWRFFTDTYGGGPEVKLKSPATSQHAHDPPRDNQNHKHSSRKYESDKEDYCTKSISETNIRDSIQDETLQKNQSLQNISRRCKVNKAATVSDDDVNYKWNIQYKKHEPNGNFDSEDDMDTLPVQYGNTVRLENGFDSSDHDANDNHVYANKKTIDKNHEVELPNLDSISLKSKPKSGKVRKTKRRTVK